MPREIGAETEAADVAAQRVAPPVAHRHLVVEPDQRVDPVGVAARRGDLLQKPDPQVRRDVEIREREQRLEMRRDAAAHGRHDRDLLDVETRARAALLRGLARAEIHVSHVPAERPLVVLDPVGRHGAELEVVEEIGQVHVDIDLQVTDLRVAFDHGSHAIQEYGLAPVATLGGDCARAGRRSRHQRDRSETSNIVVRLWSCSPHSG